MALADRAHRFSTPEYRRLVDAGGLEGFAVELLDGMLVDTSPQGEEHARVVQRLMLALSGQLTRLRVQMPLGVADGWVPEPDLAIADPDEDPTRPPSTALLVVEVSVSSLAVDRRKADVYALAGIPLYWLVDVADRSVVVHASPVAGRYEDVRVVGPGDELRADLPGVAPVAVASLFA